MLKQTTSPATQGFATVHISPLSADPNASGSVESLIRKRGHLKEDQMWKYAYPTWLENLLAVVNYNFERGLFYFCISCKKGLYQEKHFRVGAEHHDHTHLQMYHHQCALSVKWKDLEEVGVDPANIESFYASSDSCLFVFPQYMRAHFTTAISALQRCRSCRTELLQTTAKFCSLDCKFSNVQNADQYEAGNFLKREDFHDSETGRTDCTFSWPKHDDAAIRTDGSETVTVQLPKDQRIGDGGQSRSASEQDLFSSGTFERGVNRSVSRCKPLRPLQVTVPKVTIAGWWRENVTQGWIGALMAQKKEKSPFLLISNRTFAIKNEQEEIRRRLECAIHCHPKDKWNSGSCLDEGQLLCHSKGNGLSPQVHVIMNPLSSLHQFVLEPHHWWQRASSPGDASTP